MDRQYEKIILSMGFVIVQEKGNTSDGWFPEITFFDITGKKLFGTQDDIKRKLFENLKIFGKRYKKGREDKQICEFVVFPKCYDLVWKDGDLQFLEHAYDNIHKRKDIAKIIIKTESGIKILNAIKNLA